MCAGLAAAALLVVLVATAFANVLPLFQPKTVEAVSIQITDIQALSALGDYGTVTWSQQPQPEVVLSAADAKTIAGFNAPVAKYVPAGVSSTVPYSPLPKAVPHLTLASRQPAVPAAQTRHSPPPR